MTTKNASTAKTVVAAALASALAMGAAAAPALAATSPVPEETPIVAQSCSSDWAVDAAVVASPIGWGDVAYTEWYYDADADDYVVTVVSWWGDWWEVRVDAQTGCAWTIF